MNIDERIAEIGNLERRSRFAHRMCVAAALILYASLFLAAFDNHRLLALCVTFCLILCIRFLMRAHNLRVEERVLAEVKKQAANLK